MLMLMRPDPFGFDDNDLNMYGYENMFLHDVRAHPS